MSFEAAGGTVEMTIARVKEIANGIVAQSQDQARSDTQDFRDFQIGAGAYGEVPLAQAFGRQQDAAQQVFLATIHGVLTDLQAFQDNLIASADAHETNDEAIEATFAAMNTRWSAHQYSSTAERTGASSDSRLDVQVTAPQPGATETTTHSGSQSDAATGDNGFGS